MIVIDVSVLAAFALVACLLCIYAVFYFGRKLQFQTHFRNTLVDGTVRLAMDRRIRDLDNKAYSAPLDSNQNPFPSEATAAGLNHNLWLVSESSKQDRLFLPDFYDEEYPELTYDQYIEDGGNPDRTEEQFYAQEDIRKKAFEKDKAIRKAQYNKQQIGILKYKEWEIAERELFESKKAAIEKEVREEAENDLPESMDVSILGTGFSFLLEFSTVIVIIFALITLGILGTLEGREIAAILAAIAGYVLGKASRSSPTKKEETSQTTTVKSIKKLQ